MRLVEENSCDIRERVIEYGYGMCDMGFGGVCTEECSEKHGCGAVEEKGREGEVEVKDKDKDKVEHSLDKRWKGLIVCLDPGHAESTSGKRSPDGRLREYKWNREMVKRIREKLEEYGIEVYVTVDMDDEKDMGLSKRANGANEKVRESGKKGIFVSVHVNAAGMGDKWMSARGWSCWTTKGQTNSDKLSDCLYEEAKRVLVKLGCKVREDLSDRDSDYEENFTVIKKANMPAVLTENFFQDNEEDVKFLESEMGKNAIMNVHVNGILKFAERMWKM